MKIFRCLTHSVVLTIDNNKRTIESHKYDQCVIEELK